MKSSNNTNLLIEHQCPQCGAPVTLEETDRLFQCNYCRVRLYITAKNYFRYFLSPAKEYTEDTIFVPYWRFRGACFSLKALAITERVLDMNFLATRQNFLPYSLGFRAQTQKLRFADRETKAAIINHKIPFNEVIQQVETVKRFTDNLIVRDIVNNKIPLNEAIQQVEEVNHITNKLICNDVVFYNVFVGDTTSIIYSPLYIRNNAIYDAVLDRPLAEHTLLRAEMFQTLDTARDWGVNFVSALCPDCGWDLTGERVSAALFCKNCDTAWEESGGKMSKLDFGVIPNKDHDVIYIPFWKMKITFEGINLKTYADLIKIANLPKVITDKLREKELFLWAPAFNARPNLFLRLAEQLSVLQPEEEIEKRIPKSDMYPVTLKASDVMEAAKIIIADIGVPKKNIFPVIPELKLKLTESLLIYLPFKEKGDELIHEKMGISILRNALRR